MQSVTNANYFVEVYRSGVNSKVRFRATVMVRIGVRVRISLKIEVVVRIMIRIINKEGDFTHCTLVAS